MCVSLERGVTFQKRELVREMSEEAKVSELHERGVIFGQRRAGDVPEDNGAVLNDTDCVILLSGGG